MSKGSARRPESERGAYERGYEAIDWRATLHTPFGSFKVDKADDSDWGRISEALPKPPQLFPRGKRL